MADKPERLGKKVTTDFLFDHQIIELPSTDTCLALLVMWDFKEKYFKMYVCDNVG